MPEDDGNDVYRESGALDKEASSESLGMLSQQTDYSMFGDNDISDIILALPLTQTNCENPPEPPNSKTPSVTSLGKRKASESSFASSNESQNRPSKFPRPSRPLDDDNPFIETAPCEQPPDNIIILSPSLHLQRWIENKKIPYGVQYEIARLVSHGHLKYVDIEVTSLAPLANGTNDAAAPLTGRVLLNRLDATDEEFNAAWTGSFAKELAAKRPWAELDKEESARANGPYAGLGFDDEGTRQDFYGGRVHFRGTLKDVSSKGKLPVYKLILERAELGCSDQFSRRFGSKHFFRLKVAKQLFNKNGEHLLEYLQKPVALCGHVFRAFFAKEANVFYVKTNECFDGLGAIDPAKTFDGILSYLDFIKWHNNLETDSSQTMAKWASRFSLGLSNSAPGLLLSPSEIIMVPDIVSTEGSDMTDGAGTINRAGLRELRHHFSDWEHQPTCVQVRVFGAKGLLVEDKTDISETPRVQLRPSQIKIKYPREEGPDRAHLVIDVLRASHSRSPCRLSVETIINLSENKVPNEAFIKLLKQGLDELVAPLLSWDNPKDMQALWCTLRRIGGVMSARKAREDAGKARLNGYSEREAEELELDDEDGFQQLDALEQRSSAWWGDEISGCPSGLEETVMCLLDAGFTPRNCAVCCDKLEKIVKKCVKSYIKSYRIDVPMSATAFLVPDTQGILEPGEIFFKSSRRNLKTVDGSETDIVLGDVLLARYPCKLPTDMQKWKAVDRPELHHLTDVIVCSTKGPRRAADFLAGGDYDGDKGLLIFQPELVEPFVNAPLHFSKAPTRFEEANFSRHVEKVSSFLTRTSSSPTDVKIQELQKFLLGAIRDSTVGKYSTFHENAIYTKGYCHPTTIRLAYMFTTCLDGAKTGLTVRPEILAEDMKAFQARPPKWKETEEEANRVASSGGNSVNLTRHKSLGTFIMDILHREAELEGKRRLAQIEKTFNERRRHIVDPELVAPWVEATERAKRWIEEENNSRYQRDLEKIVAHVHAMYEKHRSEVNTGSPRKPRSPKKESKASFTDLPIEVRQDKIRAISKEFASWPKSGVLMADEEISRLRASYAYIYDSEKKKPNGWTRFPWDVAMRELGAIKARATGRYKCVTGHFYEDFNMKHPYKHHI